MGIEGAAIELVVCLLRGFGFVSGWTFGAWRSGLYGVVGENVRHGGKQVGEGLAASWGSGGAVCVIVSRGPKAAVRNSTGT